jgi:hypothetical protein
MRDPRPQARSTAKRGGGKATGDPRASAAPNDRAMPVARPMTFSGPSQANDVRRKNAKSRGTEPVSQTLQHHGRKELGCVPQENGSEKRSQRRPCRSDPPVPHQIGCDTLVGLAPLQPVHLIQAGSLLPTSCRLHQDFARRRIRKWLSLGSPRGRNLHQGFAAAVAVAWRGSAGRAVHSGMYDRVVLFRDVSTV